jgi:hypothetical protein
MTQMTISLYAEPNWTDAEHAVWLADMEELIKLQKKRKPQYFSFKDPKRKGSIARSVGLHFQLNEPYRRWGSTHRRKDISGYVTLEWDKRPRTLNGYPGEVYWLKDYDGPAVWAWSARPEPDTPQVFPKDRTGVDIKVGDFCLYVLHHFEKSGASTRFGTVTKIEHDGTVWAKNVKIGDDETVAEKRINDNQTILVLTKDLLDRLMILRLSST